MMCQPRRTSVATFTLVFEPYIYHSIHSLPLPTVILSILFKTRAFQKHSLLSFTLFRKQKWSPKEHNRQDREKDLSQEAKRKAEEAKNKTSETAQQAKEKTQSTMSQVKDKAAQGAEEARRKAQEAAEKGAADAVKSTIGMGKKDDQDDPFYKGTAPATTRTNTGTTGAPGTGKWELPREQEQLVN
ncbi:hypothetical protein ACLB2K_066607 [Fragaria x ananassa]